jgi:virginiamycin B lyase
MLRLQMAVAGTAMIAVLGASGVLAAPLPSLSWSPTTTPGTFDYGTVVIGDTASQAFTLTNSGGSSSAALAISLSGSSVFSIIADGCSGSALGPRSSCTVMVSYAPVAAEHDTATLTAIGKKASALAALTLSGSGPPARYIYWTNNYPDLSSVGRADIDGQNANQSFIHGGGDISGLAVDGSYIYWTRPSGIIGRADRNGQNVNQNFISGLINPVGVAVDGNYIYWSNGDAIGRADLDGQNVDNGFITTGVLDAQLIAVDGSHIYWGTYTTGNDSIGRADLDGQNVDNGFITGGSAPIGVAVNANYIYWTNYTGDTIGRADLGGQNVDHSFITGVAVFGVAVDDSYIYWSSFGDTIGRADLDGQNVNDSFITGASVSFGVAADQ